MSVSQFALGLVIAVKTEGTHFKSFHEILGLIIVILAVGQTILGQVIDKLFDPNRSAIPWYDKLHWRLGRFLFAISTVNVFLGILKYDNAIALSMGVYGAFLGLSFIVFVVAQLRLGQSHHQEDDFLPPKRNAENVPMSISAPSPTQYY
jgi:hypothetical protein